MSNHLTGDYEAVLQLSTRLINGLLATLHQNAADADAPLKLPHSALLRVGDPPAILADEVRGHFRDWVRDAQFAGGPQGVDNVREHFAAVAPPGAARMIESSFQKFGKGKAPEVTPGTVRGTVKLQLSSPTISLQNGSTSEVSLHVDVRAHYYPDPGASGVAVPEHPLHGEVRATFDVQQLAAGSGRKLHIQPSPQDDKITFTAAQGTHLSSQEVDAISAEVRMTVRESFTPLPVDMPAGFPFADFKALGSHVLALPLQLSGARLSSRHVQSVVHPFIGSSGFAFAVSKQYVESLISALTDSIKDSITNFRKVVGEALGVSIYYTAELTSGPSLTWKSGGIDFSAGIKLVGHNSLLGDFDIVVTQALTLELNVRTQAVTIRAEADPTVRGSIVVDLVEFLGGGIVSSIRDARDQALNGGINETVQNTFLDARDQLVQGLRTFDDSATARFAEIEITQNGIVVRGDAGSSVRHTPVVQIGETDQRQAFTALNSWIPGGRIERLTWSWVEHPSHGKSSIWSGVTKSSRSDEHRFILPKPAGVTELGNICLRVEGTQTSADGQVVNVDGGETCHVRHSFGPIMEVPSWWEPVTVPFWLPDSNENAVVKDLIAGHVTVQGDTLQKQELTHNSLVYFPDWQVDRPLEPLLGALAAMKRQKVSLVLVVVLPPGAFNSSRKEVEARLGGIGERFPARLFVTEDDEGGWTRTFAASKTPSAYLINARREFTWKHEGEADARELAAALDRHILPAPAPRSRPLRLARAACDCHPADDHFEDDQGQRFALHRLRGRKVLLNFWQSWSAPCIKELVRLQELHAQGGGHAPFIAAFHGGKERKAIEAIRQQHEITFPLVHDPGQQMARKYGLRCWPTTISLNEDGHINRAQFGLAHEHREVIRSEPARK